jgi:hypothetical protein
MKSLLKPLALCSALLASGCLDVVGRDSAMEKAATEFSEAADQCLLDVRDRKIPYSKSQNCTGRLHQASLAYSNFPDFRLTYSDQPVPRHAYIAESANSVAWSAAALSNAIHKDADPVLGLW